MDIDLNDPEVKAAFDAAVAKATEENETKLTAMQESIDALTGNNKKLVDEKKTVEEQLAERGQLLESLGGEDEIEALKKARGEADKAAMLKQLVEGNVEEVIAAITEKATAQGKREIEALTGKFEEVSGERDQAISKYKGKIVDIALRDAAAKADVHATALDDIVARGQQVFSVNDDDVIGVFDDDGVLKIGGDGKGAYTATEWLEDQRDAAPHWWPASQGGGAGGSQHQTTQGSSYVITREQASDHAAYQKARAAAAEAGQPMQIVDE
jgi:hypothetical protein